MSHLTHRKQTTLIVRRPRITEKSSHGTENRVYVFEVDLGVNKKEIRRAIKELYGINPIKIAIAKIPTKTVTRKAGYGKTARSKKAIIYLKEGDKIEFV